MERLIAAGSLQQLQDISRHFLEAEDRTTYLPRYIKSRWMRRLIAPPFQSKQCSFATQISYLGLVSLLQNRS